MIQNYNLKSNTESNFEVISSKSCVEISDYIKREDIKIEVDLSRYKDNKPKRRIIKGSIING